MPPDSRLENSLKSAEDELALIKNQIQQPLLDIREHVLQSSNPFVGPAFAGPEEATDSPLGSAPRADGAGGAADSETATDDEQSGEGLAHYAKVLDDKGYLYDTHWAPHDIEVRELGSGLSRIETAKSLGINFKVAPKLSIEDGINAARMRFNTLWIDEEKCAPFIHCISLYHKEWDDKRGEFRNQPFHDFTSHYADALRYWAVTKADKTESMSVYKPKWKSYGKRDRKKVVPEW